MTELKKGTVKIDYKYYFCDPINGNYVMQKFENCNKLTLDDGFKRNQEKIIKNLNKMTGGNFVPIAYEEYVKNIGEDEE